MNCEERFKKLLSDYVYKMAGCYDGCYFEPDEEANDAYNELYDFFLKLKGDGFDEKKES